MEKNSRDNWLKNIDFEDNEVNQYGETKEQELRRWCEIIGYERYKEYYDLLVKFNKQNNREVNKILYSELKECAMYDCQICKVLYSIFRFVEMNCREFILRQDISKEKLKKYEN